MLKAVAVNVSEVKQVGAELRHIKLNLTRVLVREHSQVIKDLVEVFPRVERHNDVENLCFARQSATVKAPAAIFSLTWPHQILQLSKSLLPVLDTHTRSDRVSWDTSGVVTVLLISYLTTVLKLR